MTEPIYPCLWFDGQAKAAAEYYCRIFKNSRILSESPMVVIFDLDGRKFMGLNGGPHFKFNEAVSFVINCKDQQEIDYFWNSLTADGGRESMCGWLVDKFGVSWQVVPHNISQLLGDPTRGQRAMAALLKMKKLDIKTLENV